MEKTKKKRTNWKKKFQDLEKKYNETNEEIHHLKGQVNSLQKENQSLDSIVDSQKLKLTDSKKTIGYTIKLLDSIKSRESWNPFKTVRIYKEKVKSISEKLSKL